MKVLVCGGREFDDWGVLSDVLERHMDGAITEIIQGGAKGADFLARAWAKYEGIPFHEYPADWKAYGPRAGGIRNQRMLDEGKPDWVIAFPGGRGTADMVRRANQAGVRVREIHLPTPDDTPESREG